MTHQPPQKKKRDFSELPGLLFGWIFIVAVLFGIVVMILHSKPERKMICDKARRPASLTQFGSCHWE